MQFTFPTKRLNDSTWFLDSLNVRRHGKIFMINIAIKEGECTIWYSIMCNDVAYVARESSVIEGDPQLPIPKYRIGEEVDYTFLATDKSFYLTSGIINKIEVVQQDKLVGVLYYMEDDPELWVNEEEIQTFTEPKVEVVNADVAGV